MRKLLLLHILLMMFTGLAAAQVSDSTATDSTAAFTPVLKDTIRTGSNFQLRQPEVEEVKTIGIWRHAEDLFSHEITNDSLLRWQIWPNWGDFYGYRSDALTYRMGTIGRLDAFTIRGYDSYEQEVRLDEIRMNDPVTGLVNYNDIPHHKIGMVKERYTGHLTSAISTKDYYIIKPISYLNYDESSNDYRNLEFMVAQNTSPGTNVEISYWDRRDGGYYPNNSTQGSQIFGKLYHHIGPRYQLQAMILRNQFENEESGGYLIGNPDFFSFDEFGSIPNSISGESNRSRTDMKVGLYERPDSLGWERSGVVISRTRNDFRTTIFSDTLGWDMKGYTAQAFRRFELGSLNLHTTITGSLISNPDSTTISESSWNMLDAEARAQYSLGSTFSLNAGASRSQRSDDQSGNELYAGFVASTRSGLELEIGGAAESRMPSIQSLYWRSRHYSGNPDLRNEEVSSIYGSLTKSWDRLSMGIHGRLKTTKDPIYMAADSSFVNATSYDVINGGFFVRFESPSLEIESAASGEYTLNENFSPELRDLVLRDTKLVIRNSAFLKRYAFDRAAFIKMGVRTVWAPFITERSFYNAELNYWQPNSEELGVPAYFRMDAELSARVRSIMVVIRWENTLDGFGQQGYFETAAYPMMPRRLLVGIRAQFRN